MLPYMKTCHRFGRSRSDCKMREPHCSGFESINYTGTQQGHALHGFIRVCL